MSIKGDMVTITKEEYRLLQENQQFLECLVAVGVDNWNGYDVALDDYNAMYGDDE